MKSRLKTNIAPIHDQLKRLYWNCRAFRTGRRRQKTPYGLLGVTLPTSDWWELLRLTPEQLRQQLSAPGVAA